MPQTSEGRKQACVVYFSTGTTWKKTASSVTSHYMLHGRGIHVTREQTIERLRIWAARAYSEAEHADTRANRLNWQGQAQVLTNVAAYLAGQGADATDEECWEQVVTDRQQALGAWQQEQEGSQAMLYSGMVAGYDVALTAIKDLMGREFPQNRLAIG